MLHELRLKNIDDEIVKRLKAEASVCGVDLNTYVLSLLKKVLGIDTREKCSERYGDLDYLAGTWTKEDAEIFKKSTSDFNKIDPDLWK